MIINKKRLLGKLRGLVSIGNTFESFVKNSFAGACAPAVIGIIDASAEIKNDNKYGENFPVESLADENQADLKLHILLPIIVMIVGPLLLHAPRKNILYNL